MLFFGLERLRQTPLHLANRLLRAIEIAARVPDLREIEPRAIAHAFRRLRRQQLFEALAGFVVQTEREIQPAEQQLGFVVMMRELAPLLVGIEARDRFEVVLLIEIEEDVAVMKILDLRFRQSVGILWRREGG